MGSYSFHFVFEGKVTTSREIDFPDDLDALERARRMATAGDVVVWNGHRYVARVKRNGEAATPLDRRAG